MSFGQQGAGFGHQGAAGERKSAGGGGGGGSPNDLKFWFDGLPFDRLAASSTPTGGVKFWTDGVPVDFIN